MNNFIIKYLTSSTQLFFRSISKHNVGKPISCHGFKYYPRHSDEKDEPYTPSKLFLVKRIKSLKGESYILKDVMSALGFRDRKITKVIVKNTPDMNEKLWRVKHLIRLIPIKFPNGEPSEADINSTYLRENGDFLIAKSLEPSEEVKKATEKFEKQEKVKMDGETLKKILQLKWNQSYHDF